MKRIIQSKHLCRELQYRVKFEDLNSESKIVRQQTGQ